MRKVIYWLTVFPALFDAIKGAISGIKKGLEDINDLKAKKKEEEQNEAFEKANRGEQNL